MVRNYACFFTQSDTILPHYLRLIDAFRKGCDFTPPFHDINFVQKNYLEIYVKKQGEFSRFLHDLPLGPEAAGKNEFNFRGPFVTFMRLLFLGTWIEIGA